MSFQTNVDKTIKNYNRRLDRISEKGIPAAAEATLNNMAFESRKLNIHNFEKNFIIRSNWTQRGMLFQKVSRGTPIMNMESRSGNIRDYAKDLEAGATIVADNEYVPIPALGSRISKSKRKRIAKRFQINRVKARRLPSISGSPQRRFAAMLNIGRKEKYYGPFLVTHDEAGSARLPRGIFNLSGQGRQRRGGGTITMLRKLEKLVILKGKPFVMPAGVKIGRRMDRIYVKNAQRILKKFSGNIN